MSVNISGDTVFSDHQKDVNLIVNHNTNNPWENPQNMV